MFQTQQIGDVVTDDKLSQMKQTRELFTKQQRELHAQHVFEIDSRAYAKFLRENAEREKNSDSKIQMIGK